MQKLRSALLQLKPEDLGILKGEALPENLKLVVLQHSDDGKRLLCTAISSARLDPTPPEPVEVEEGEEPPPLPPVPVCAVSVADLPHSLEALSEESAKFSKAVRQFLVSGGSAATQEPAGLESRNPRFNKAEEVGAAWAMHTAHLSEYLSPVLGALHTGFMHYYRPSTLIAHPWRTVILVARALSAIGCAAVCTGSATVSIPTRSGAPQSSDIRISR